MLVDVTLFLPSSKEMRLEYPELASIEEFKMLTDKQLKFVWWFANPTSPLVDDTSISKEANERKRIALALIKSKLKDDLTIPDQEAYTQMYIPEQVRIAIHRMQAFTPSIRMHGKIMQEKIFENYNNIINTVIPSNASADQKKEYVDLAKVISTEIPKLIGEIEDAYGIKMKKRDEDKKTGQQPKLMDKLMDGE